MKKGFLIILLAVSILLIGCGEKETESKQITVSYVEDSAHLYSSVLRDFKNDNPDLEVVEQKYSSVSEMETQLTAQISGGECPDVILFDRNTTLDVERLIKSNLFLDLSSYLTSYLEQEDAYYTKIIGATATEKGQYILPLGFSVPALLTTEEAGVINQTATGLELLSAMTDHMKKTAEADTMTMLPRIQMNFAWWLNHLGFSVIKGNEVVLQKEQVQMVAEFYRAFTQDYKKTETLLQDYATDFAGIASHVDIMLGEDYLPTGARYYDSLYGLGIDKHFVLGTIPNQQGGISATVTHLGMVSKNSGNKNASVRLLLSCLGKNLLTSDEMNIPISLSKNVMNGNLELVKNSTGKSHIKIGSSFIQVSPLSRNLAQEVAEICDRVDAVVLPNAKLAEIINSCMQDYFNGDMEFDAAWDQMFRRLNIYANE